MQRATSQEAVSFVPFGSFRLKLEQSIGQSKEQDGVYLWKEVLGGPEQTPSTVDPVEYRTALNKINNSPNLASVWKGDLLFHIQCETRAELSSELQERANSFFERRDYSRMCKELATMEKEEALKTRMEQFC